MDKEQALKYLKDKLTMLNPETREALEALHPELKDSESEITRKKLIQYIYHETNLDKKDKDEFLSWLYDQNEENPDNLYRFSIYRYDDDLKVLFLSDVFVGEFIRGKGYGNQILEVAELIAKKVGAEFISLKVKEYSIAYNWYERHGYKIYAAAEDDETYVWMRKKIGPDWYPSIGQLKALKGVIEETKESWYSSVLLTLFNDLKKKYDIKDDLYTE